MKSTVYHYQTHVFGQHFCVHRYDILYAGNRYAGCLGFTRKTDIYIKRYLIIKSIIYNNNTVLHFSLYTHLPYLSYTGVPGQSIPPAGIYPPRLDYTRVYYSLGQFIPRGVLWPRPIHTSSGQNIPS